MKIDLILHGVPNGHDLWGGDDDSQYFSAMYNNVSTQEMKEFLMIETRQISSKTYCYYNYLKYNNVRSNEGRTGSYIGITIRIDAFCKDILSIYNLCEILYKRLSGIIFETSGISTRYIVTHFGLKHNNLINLQSAIIDWFRLSTTQSDFVSINSIQNGNSKKLNLVDCSSENILTTLSRYSKLYISKYYHTLSAMSDIKRIEEQHRSEMQQKDNVLSQLNIQFNAVKHDNERLRSENTTLQGDLEIKNRELNDYSNLKRRLDEKEQKCRELEILVTQNRNSKRVEDLIRRIEEPLRTLSHIASGSCNVPYAQLSEGKRTENSNKKQKGKFKKRKKLMFSLLTIISLSLVVFLGWKFIFESSDSSPKAKTKTETKIENVKQEVITNE